MKRNISRRDFLKFSLLGIAAAFFAACKRVTQPTEPPFITTTSTCTDTPKPTATSTHTPTETLTSTSLPCFELLTPEDGVRLNSIGRVKFSWEAIPDAAGYLLEITLPTNQKVVFETTETNRDQYLEAFSLGGSYYWQVTALNETGEEICTTGPFTFEKPEYLPPPSTPTQDNDTGSDSSSTSNGSDSSATGSWSDVSEG